MSAFFVILLLIVRFMNSEKSYYCIGSMSGTSLDGLDLAYIYFRVIDSKIEYKILYTETIPYTTQWSEKLKKVFFGTALDLVKINVDYGKYIGEAVNSFVKKFKIQQVDFVASHGQTIFHNPAEGYTCQIGSGATIAATCGYKVISDFRTQDVALGGQGAPLVPIGDKIFFSDFDYCINIGGFANISYEKDQVRKAFDICPANIILNHYAEKNGADYDANGAWARSGKTHFGLLKSLDQLSIYSTKDSMSFEKVESEIIPLIESFNLSIQDVLNTVSEHIAIKIANAMDKKGRAIITGGGALNSYLIERINKNTAVEIIIPETQIIQFKEALIFALLGLLKLENRVNCLSSVTRARKDHSSGVIFNPN